MDPVESATILALQGVGADETDDQSRSRNFRRSLSAETTCV
jgi:hypothetical protein